MVLNLLKDSQKLNHWTLSPSPLLLRPESLPPESSARNSLTAGGRQVAPSVCHDVICVQASSDPIHHSSSSSSSSGFCSCVVRQLLKRLLAWLPVRFRRNSVEIRAIER